MDLFWFFLPLALTGIAYDSQRYFAQALRGRIRVEEPYLFDRTFFGISLGDGRVLTPNEWWQLHTHWGLDLVTGFFYLTFIALFFLTALYFRFRLGRKDATRMTWGFFWLNLLGYSTYYWYPAAPPWYVALHGLGPARLDTPPSAAGCIRFDELLGTHFFTGMYAQSANVFGAIPSLHIAYPLLAVWFAFRFKAARAWTVGFYLIMCFSAVYLNHHYVLDLLWGSAYALLVGWAVTRCASKSSRTPFQP